MMKKVTWEINPARTALIVVDMQKVFWIPRTLCYESSRLRCGETRSGFLATVGHTGSYHISDNAPHTIRHHKCGRTKHTSLSYITKRRIQQRYKDNYKTYC